MKKVVVIAAVVIVAIAFGVGLRPRSTTLASAVEEYVGGLGISGVSYEVARQTENEAEVVEDGQTQRMPRERKGKGGERG